MFRGYEFTCVTGALGEFQVTVNTSSATPDLGSISVAYSAEFVVAKLVCTVTIVHPIVISSDVTFFNETIKSYIVVTEHTESE